MVALADGDFVHLDGDDFWLPGKLREQVAAATSGARLRACCANASVFDDRAGACGDFSAMLIAAIRYFWTVAPWELPESAARFFIVVDSGRRCWS